MNALTLLQHPLELAHLPTLPTEVIEEVIDQARNDRRSLRNLSLLCKELLTRARIHLFTAIIIWNVEQMESSHEFLDSHPWVPLLVQRVTLFVNIPDDYLKMHIPLLEVFHSHLFSRLPNLHTWRMIARIPHCLESSQVQVRVQLAFHPSTLLCYRIYSRNIRTLELEEIHFPDISHFIRLVSAFTSLQSLVCSDILVWSEHQTPLLDLEIIRKLSKPLKLEYLTVRMLVTSHVMDWMAPNNTELYRSIHL